MELVFHIFCCFTPSQITSESSTTPYPVMRASLVARSPICNPTNCCEMVGPHHSHLQHAINYSFILLSAHHFAAMLSMATGAGVELEAAADEPAGVLPFRWGSVGDEEAADVLT